MARGQIDLFGDAGPRFPRGFRYEEDILTTEEERALIERFRGLPFKEFEFHGYRGKRRTVSYGWHYDFAAATLRKSDDMPDFLRELRVTAARFAGLEATALQHALVIEYGEGAGIGWHRDKPVFGDVVGLSLLSPCLFRLRRRAGTKWDRVSLTAQPRSAYLLRGPSRTEWEHSIPPVDALRYSVTFRNLREG